VKPAWQRDEALLADIAKARSSGQARVWWLGQSGFLVHAGRKNVLFDPYLSDSLTKKYQATDKPHTRLTERVIEPGRLTCLDLITCSHNHTDHLDAETLLPLFEANPEAKLLIPRANRAFVLDRLGPVPHRLLEVDAGETVRAGELTFHGIPAAHNEVEFDEHGCCRFLGYVAQVGPFTFYHSGDTLMHPGLVPALRRFSIDVAFVPINGNKPAREIGAGLAIPHHFDMFAFNTEPPDSFEAECRRLGQCFHTLQNGEGLNLN
jgi:L-ascorbate metabolism protein UlaG (beta-lactamase superfamily)